MVRAWVNCLVLFCFSVSSVVLMPNTCYFVDRKLHDPLRAKTEREDASFSPSSQHLRTGSLPNALGGGDPILELGTESHGSPPLRARDQAPKCAPAPRGEALPFQLRGRGCVQRERSSHPNGSEFGCLGQQKQRRRRSVPGEGPGSPGGERCPADGHRERGS